MKYSFSILVFILLLSSCSVWIQDAEPSPGTIGLENRNQPSLFGSLDKNQAFVPGPHINAVQHAASNVSAALYAYTGAMADEFAWVPKGNVLIYKDLDEDALDVNNGSLQGIWAQALAYYFLAEDAIEFAQNTNWNDSPPQIRQEALWYLYLHQGIALYYLGAYFQADPAAAKPYIYLNAKQIGNEKIFEMAAASLENALQLGSVYQQRVANTILARIALLTNDGKKAARYAGNMLTDGDKPLLTSYEVLSNTLFLHAGNNSRECQIKKPFLDLLTTVAAKQRCPTITNETNQLVVQNRYGLHDPLELTSFAEASLIRAELIAGNYLNGNFTDEINRLMLYYDHTGSSATTTAAPSIALVQQYRQVFLAWQGQRMLDLRRWQLAGGEAKTFSKRKWQYIGIDHIEYPSK